MNIRCLIIDDEPLALDLLESFIAKIPFLCCAGKCYNGIEALKFLESHEVEVVFLDISMPHLSGMELSSLLPARTRIIFTTAYSDYAVDSYDRNAIDYLLKPITFDRFLKSIIKVKEAMRLSSAGENNPLPASRPEVLFVKSGKKVVQIDLEGIAYIEGMKDYAIFHYLQEKIYVHKRLKDLEKTLPAYIQRIHLSYFINIKRIKKIEDNHVFVNDVRLPISNKYRVVFLSTIHQNLF